MSAPDPLAVRCPRCSQPIDLPCRSHRRYVPGAGWVERTCKPHAARIRAAEAAEAEKGAKP